MKTAQITTDRQIAIGCFVLVAGLACQPRTGWTEDAYDPMARVSNARLDATRGGVNVDSILLSIGISRAVFVNNELVITTTLNIPGLGPNLRINAPATLLQQLGAGAASDGAGTAVAKSSPAKTDVSKMDVAKSVASKTSAAAPGVSGSPVVILSDQGMTLVQNGAGNIAPQNLPSAGSIVQNTLDNQALRTVTTINAKVHSQAFTKGLNMRSSMRDTYYRR